MGPQTIMSEDGCIFTEECGISGMNGAALASLWGWMGGCACLGQWVPSSKPFLDAPLMPQFVNNELMSGQHPHLGQRGSG